MYSSTATSSPQNWRPRGLLEYKFTIRRPYCRTSLRSLHSNFLPTSELLEPQSGFKQRVVVMLFSVLKVAFWASNSFLRCHLFIVANGILHGTAERDNGITRPNKPTLFAGYKGRWLQLTYSVIEIAAVSWSSNIFAPFGCFSYWSGHYLVLRGTMNEYQGHYISIPRHMPRVGCSSD